MTIRVTVTIVAPDRGVMTHEEVCEHWEVTTQGSHQRIMFYVGTPPRNLPTVMYIGTSFSFTVDEKPV